MIKFFEEDSMEDLAGREIVFLSGLPGIGNVGKIVVDTLIEKLQARKVTTIFFEDFPSQVIVNKNGGLNLPRIHLFHSRVNDKHDFLMMTGDFQPTTNVGTYNFIEKLMDYLIKEKNLRISLIISMGAYVPEHIPMSPKIFVSGTNEEEINLMIESDDEGIVEIMEGGIITGANGIIPAWGEIIDVPGICLLAETIPMLKKDPKAAKILVDLILKRFEFKIDIEELDKLSKEMDFTLEQLKKRAGIIPDEKEKEPKVERQSYIG